MKCHVFTYASCAESVLCSECTLVSLDDFDLSLLLLQRAYLLFIFLFLPIVLHHDRLLPLSLDD